MALVYFTRWRGGSVKFDICKLEVVCSIRASGGSERIEVSHIHCPVVVTGTPTNGCEELLVVGNAR